MCLFLLTSTLPPLHSSSPQPLLLYAFITRLQIPSPTPFFTSNGSALLVDEELVGHDNTEGDLAGGTRASQLQRQMRVNSNILDRFELCLVVAAESSLTKDEYVKVANRIVKDAVGASGLEHELECTHVRFVREHGASISADFNHGSPIKLDAFAERFQRANKSTSVFSAPELSSVFSSIGFDDSSGILQPISPTNASRPAMWPLIDVDQQRSEAVRLFSPSVTRADAPSLKEYGLQDMYYVKPQGKSD